MCIFVCVAGSRSLVASVEDCWCNGASGVPLKPCARCLCDLHRLRYAQGECDGADQFDQEIKCDPEVLQVSVVWVCALNGCSLCYLQALQWMSERTAKQIINAREQVITR